MTARDAVKAREDAKKPVRVHVTVTTKITVKPKAKPVIDADAAEFDAVEMDRDLDGL